MTLRRLLQSFTADDAARDEAIADPAGTLARAGFDALDDDLLGTALVHHADTAPVDELDALVPLLERFAPIDGVVRTLPDPIDEADPIDPVDDDVGPGDVDDDTDPALVFDDLAADAEPDPAVLLDELADAAGAPPVIGEPSAASSTDAFGTGAIPIIGPAGPPDDAHDQADLGTPSMHDRHEALDGAVHVAHVDHLEQLDPVDHLPDAPGLDERSTSDRAAPDDDTGDGRGDDTTLLPD